MAEPQKGASSTAHSKERTSLLDEEIGNEFLSSWKSATAGDDTLDFNCGTVSHGRKKPFDFDKLDMDFALDGGFEKISSFKIDMSDLDFSSPPRKTEKPKEKSGKESVLGRKERKQDRFTFSFDFTELDGFDLDSSLLNGEKKSDKNPGDIGLHTSVKPERGQDSMSNSATSVDTFENSDTSKLLPLDDATTSKFVLPKGVCGNMDTETNGAPSVSENLGNQNCLHDGTSPEKQITTFVQESKSECHKTVQHTEQSETTGSTEPCVLYAIQDTSSQPVSGDNSLLGTGPELQTGLSSLYAEVNTSPSRESDNSVKSVDNSQSKDSSPINSYNLQNSPATCITESKETHTEFQKYSTGPNHVAKENAIGEESARSSIGFGDAAMTSGSQKLNNATVVIENPYSVFKALLPLHRESTVGKPMPLKEKATGVIHSKYFNKSEDHESQLHSASTPRKASLCNKKLEGMHLGLANTKSPKFGGNEKQAGNHKVGISESNGRALIEAPVMGSEKNDKVLDTSGESTVDKPMPLKEKATSVIHSKYFGKSEVTESQLQSASALRKVSLCNKTLEGMHLSPANTKRPNFGGNEKQAAIHKVGISESTGRALKKAPVILGSEKNDKEINTSGFQVHTANLPEQTIISGTPKSSTPKFAVSNIEPRRDSKIISAEKHKKISLLRSDMKSFVFSGINITSAMASKSDSSNSTFQKEIKSLKQPEKNMGMLLTMASKMAPSVNTEKYALICPSLKRKSSEVPCPDPMNLNPLKRAIESYSESRNVQEVSQRIEEKMIPKIINPEDSYKSVCFDHPTPKLDVPLEASMTDFEVLTYIESDVNVEKAEACAKELDAICNMLKKKHNEAKEVLVRAIVNNNLLLMLNHPTYEEKIHTIQRSAASMLSKEHQTRSN